MTIPGMDELILVQNHLFNPCHKISYIILSL